MPDDLKDQEFRKKLREAHDFALQEKEKAKRQIEHIIVDLDPIELLSHIAFISQYIPEGNPEINQNIREYPSLQFLSGLYLKFREPGTRHPENKEIEMLLETVESYFTFFMQDLILQSFKKDTVSDTDGLILQARLQRIVRQVNATIYPFQLDILIRDLFSHFDDYFLRTVGFRASKALEFGRKIINRYERLINKRYEESRLAYINAKEELRDPVKGPAIKELMGKNISEQDYLNSYSAFLLFSNTKDLFVFNPDEACREEGISDIAEFKSYLTTLSCRFGDNQTFDNFLDNNVISTRPFIWADEGRYFAPISQDLLYNLPRFLELILEPEKASQSSTWQKYQSKRARFVEDRIYEYFSRLFPKDRIYRNVKYVFQGKECEADIIILYDNKTFLIESKSGSFTEQAQRGGIDSLKKDLKKLVEEAHQQGKRTIDYIKSGEVAVFTDMSGNKALELNRNSNKIFIVSVTLEPLMSFSASLKNLGSLGLFVDNEYPWSVHLNELDIVTKHLPSPTIFIHYLENRLQAIDENIFHAFDELSFLGWYLKQGNFIVPRTKDDKKPNIVTLASDWVAAFDDHYLFGKASPQLIIEEDLLKVVRILEYINPIGYSDISSALLDFDHDARKLIFGKINELIELSKNDHKPHDFSVLYKEVLDTGLTFMTILERHRLRERLGSYCTIKKYQMKARRWIGIGRDVSDERWYVNEFAFLDNPWEHNSKMDKLLRVFPMRDKGK